MQTTFVYVTHDQAEALTLADRIVVMRDGVVQQIGTPDEIYERPANTFVASFLGSPPINYIDGVLEVGPSGAAFRTGGGLALALPEAMAQRLASQDGREVRLGIRAEDVSEGAAVAGVNALAGTVNSVLPVGSDQYLGMDFAGSELFFRVGKDLRHRSGDTITLAVDSSRLHLFDRDSGASLVA